MTVDEIVAALPDFLLEQAEGAEHIAVGIDLSGDAQLPRLLGKGPLHEADHVHLDGPGQVLEQGEHMGFGAAAVAAADEMYGFHTSAPFAAFGHFSGDGLPRGGGLWYTYNE